MMHAAQPSRIVRLSGLIPTLYRSRRFVARNVVTRTTPCRRCQRSELMMIVSALQQQLVLIPTWLLPPARVGYRSMQVRELTMDRFGSVESKRRLCLVRPLKDRCFASSSTSSYCPRANSIRWMTQSSNSEQGDSDRQQSLAQQQHLWTRRALLHEQLTLLDIEPSLLQQADLQQQVDPVMVGYDGQFGKSAIRTYRAFVHGKNAYDNSLSWSGDNAQPMLIAAAGRCAQQIHFLMERHQAHQVAWVRHSDTKAELGGRRKETDAETESTFELSVTTENDIGTDSVVRDQQCQKWTQHRTFPVVIVLDQVRSAYNVGSLLRTADATGCTAVITVGVTPHDTIQLQKTALGAEYALPPYHVRTMSEAVTYIQSVWPHYTWVGMETTSRSIAYTNYSFPIQGVVLVLGNEVTGVSADTLERYCHAVVEIPMYGIKNSLNIAAAAPVVLYEIIRQWQQTEPVFGGEQQ